MAKKPLFDIGRLVITQGVATSKIEVTVLLELVHRHVTGDFGKICEEDRLANLHGVENGLRVISAYQVQETRLWIITEADRTSTTILFPEEY
jgi:hypothetical protein